jgi:hypothetical protein
MKAVLEALAEGSVTREAVTAWVSTLAPVRSTQINKSCTLRSLSLTNPVLLVDGCRRPLDKHVSESIQ